MRTYILYKTTCLINGKIYIGVHQTDTPYEFDGYIGCGIASPNSHADRTAFHKAVQKYGYDNFKRETLEVFHSKKKAYKREAEIVNLEFLLQDNNYNTALGGGGGSLKPKPIYQFNLEGKLLSVYRSAFDAAKTVHRNEDRLRTAVKHKLQCAGSLWANVSEIDVSEYNTTAQNNYYIYSTDGELLQEFQSLTAVTEFLDSNSANVSRSIALKNKVHGYFITTEKLENFNVLITPKIKSKVHQYSAKGRYIASFDTIQQARSKTGLKLCSISQAIKLKHKCNGYYWTRSINPSPSIKVSTSRTPKKVAVYKHGKLLKVFSSLQSAKKAYPSCQACLRGLSKQSKGCTFKYL